MFSNLKNLSKLEGDYIFIDNDFLSALFHNEDLLRETLEVFVKNYFVIDPFVQFEFLRGVFLSKQLELKINFVTNKEVFSPADDHQEIYNKLRINAVILSQIYEHQNQKSKSKSKGSSSFVDLFLASRLMDKSLSSVLITGNKKDFPTCVFDALGVLNHERADGDMQAFSILRFNREKFDVCYKELQSIPAK